MAYSLGIDLGTTLSAAATARDGLIEIVQLGELTATMPSIVVVRADVEVLVGDAAERESANEPTRTARGFKRRLGDPTPIVLGGKPYGAEALLAHLLRAIVARVSEEAGGPPDAIVLTHPASYGADKIALLEGAVRQAGIENVTFLTEPEAAAIHDDQRDPLTVGAVVAVYDFGGGTFDAAILRKTETGFEEARDLRGDGASRRHRLRRGVLQQRGRLRPRERHRGGRGRPGDRRRPGAAAGRGPAGQGGAVVRTRNDGPRRPARLPDRAAAHPRGLRGPDPSPHRRDDRGTGAGDRERGPHLPRAGPRPARSAGRHGSRWLPRWSARRPVGRSRSMRRLEGLDRAGSGLRRRAAAPGCCDGRRGGRGRGRGGRHGFDPRDGGGGRDGRGRRRRADAAPPTEVVP